MEDEEMDQSAIVMPNDAEENPRTNRDLQLPSYFSSRQASVLSIFCIGVMSGAAGGLLLGGIAVVMLQSLEVLVENRLFMEQLENTLSTLRENKMQDTSHWTRQEHMPYIFVCSLFEVFGVLSATLLLIVGLVVGLSTYKLVIKRYGEAAIGKALALSGSVCLMVITASGLTVGYSLEGFIFNWTIYLVLTWGFPVVLLIIIFWCIFPCCRWYCHSELLSTYVLLPVLYSYFMAMAFLYGMSISVMFQTKLSLVAVLLPIIGLVSVLKCPVEFQLTITPVPLMLLLTDVFNIARHPIVTLQSATNTSSIVVEGIFVGVLTSQLLMVAIGMSLFLYWQQGGAAKICASATASGTAVLAVIRSILPVLGPGPTLGAVMGVSGAVGVSLSAAGAATDRYREIVDQYGWVGRLGVTVGAGVGAFLSSCAHSGLSHMFMGLCGAVIPAGPDLMLLLFQSINRSDRLKLFLRITIAVMFLTWLYFTITSVGIVIVGVILLSQCCWVLVFVLGLCCKYARSKVQWRRVRQTMQNTN